MIQFRALPPKEAIAFFEKKGYKISFSWEDVWQSEHQASFTVAKVMQLDILRDIRGGVDAALKDGTTFETFRQQLKPLLMEKGWWGKAEMIDPLTGESKLVQLGSTRRLRTIFDTNLRTAYSEGQWQRIQATKRTFKYLVYNANNSENPRLEHSAWDNLVLPADDPFWKNHFPVKDYGCKCFVTQATDKMLEQRGLKVNESPKVGEYTYINKRTGEIQKIPRGVHPSFHYPPGGRRENLSQFITGKIIQSPADVGAAWWQASSPLLAAQTTVPGIADNFRKYVTETFSKTAHENKFAVAGVAHPEDIKFLSSLGKTPQSAEIAVPENLMIGKKAQRHEAAGDALTQAEWLAIPEGIANPTAVLYDNETGNLLYVMDAGSDPRVQKLVVQMDFVAKKQKRTINMARSGFKIKSEDLKAGIKGGRYAPVRGAIE